MATVLRGSDNFDTDGAVDIKDRVATAWVLFDAGTQTISDAYNVSSITDDGTGKSTVNFTTAMDNANLVLAGALCSTSDTTSAYSLKGAVAGPTVSTMPIITTGVTASTATYIDFPITMAIIFGGKN